MKAREYAVLELAVENGVEYGWNRAHKYTDTPDPSAIRATIMGAVMHEVSEWFQFEDSPEIDE